MPRNVAFNLVIDKTRTDGSFGSTGWFQETDGSWSPLPPLPGKESDSAQLQTNDNVWVAIGEKLPPSSTTTAVSAITLAVVFGSRPSLPTQANSPFQNAQGTPTCLYVGNTGDSTLQPSFDSNNNNGGYFAWKLNLGTVPQTARGTRFELMVGANVTFNDGTPARSFGHDPEVDVGMD
jgi:hypothetical protein